MRRPIIYIFISALMFSSLALAQPSDSFADDHFGSSNSHVNNNADTYNPLAGSFLNDQGSSNYSGAQQGSQQWNNSFSTPNNPSSLGGEMYGPMEVP